MRHAVLVEPGKPENTTDMTSHSFEGYTLWVPDEISFEEDSIKVDLYGFLPWSRILLVSTAHVPEGGCGS